MLECALSEHGPFVLYIMWHLYVVCLQSLDVSKLI